MKVLGKVTVGLCGVIVVVGVVLICIEVSKIHHIRKHRSKSSLYNDDYDDEEHDDRRRTRGGGVAHEASMPSPAGSQQHFILIAPDQQAQVEHSPNASAQPPIIITLPTHNQSASEQANSPRTSQPASPTSQAGHAAARQPRIVVVDTQSGVTSTPQSPQPSAIITPHPSATSTPQPSVASSPQSGTVSPHISNPPVQQAHQQQEKQKEQYEKDTSFTQANNPNLSPTQQDKKGVIVIYRKDGKLKAKVLQRPPQQLANPQSEGTNSVIALPTASPSTSQTSKSSSVSKVQISKPAEAIPPPPPVPEANASPLSFANKEPFQQIESKTNKTSLKDERKKGTDEANEYSSSSEDNIEDKPTQ